MKRVIRKPYLFFWILTPIILLIGIFWDDDSLDINIHDTYIIINKLHLSIIISFLLFLTGVLYFIIKKLKRNPTKILTAFHLLLTLISVIVLYFYASKDFSFEHNSPKRYYESNSSMIDYIEINHIVVTLSILSFLIGQFIVFPINIIVSSFRKKTEI